SLGSGSACRGVFGGFVHWKAGIEPDGSDCRCEVLAPPEHWRQLMAVVVVASSVTKPCSSTDGMQRSAETSSFLHYRVKQLVPDYIRQMKTAIQCRNFAKFAELTMRDSNQLHAVCMDTYPPLMYLSDTSRHLMLLVHCFNQMHNETKVAYTFDAGSNCCLIMNEDIVSEFLSYLCYYFPNHLEKKFIRGILPMVDCTMLSHCQIPGFTSLPNSVEYVVVTRLGSSPVVLF
ncbi:unnamed protein product, partial [Soboliphyme baturini]|uniref:Diphosphomevalonate decarboxylase n=1 Tax=Soboliphyme baturini TaxID=241478 RepID=A0A183J945_9BILA